MRASSSASASAASTYPLAATVAAESASDSKSRGVKVSLVFSTQGLGFIMSPIIGLIVCNLNPSPHVSMPDESCWANWTDVEVENKPDCIQLFTKGPADKMYCADGANDMNWRIVLALGALPARPAHDAVPGDRDLQGRRRPNQAVHLSWPTSPGPSTGASCSAPRTAAWFLFDIVFYGNTLFKGAILAVLSKEQSLNDNLVHSTILFVRQLRK